jgi:uncharacterized protein (TIGR02246 family)
MPSHALEAVVAAADAAINREDFAALMDFYTEEATLVVRPGLNVSGKKRIGEAFVAIADYFQHSLRVEQSAMQVIEGGDTALVMARAHLVANGFSAVRLATYVFRRDDGVWRCVIDNSYGTELVSALAVADDEPAGG